jgi:2-oxoglutarate dehydrogenase E1 component
MQVVNCTTPANQFHVLRRQIKRDFRKPLICFTPKKLLRYPSCVSMLKDFTTGGFQEVVDDPTASAKEVKKVVFCSGKVYYDLSEGKEKAAANEVAIVRLEQLYPFPIKQVAAILNKYKAASEYVWAQEEPENMGAWAHVVRFFMRYSGVFEGINLKYVGRAENASPATGFSKAHAEQQQHIVDAVVSLKSLV